MHPFSPPRWLPRVAAACGCLTSTTTYMFYSYLVASWLSHFCLGHYNEITSQPTHKKHEGDHYFPQTILHYRQISYFWCLNHNSWESISLLLLQTTAKCPTMPRQIKKISLLGASSSMRGGWWETIIRTAAPLFDLLCLWSVPTFENQNRAARLFKWIPTLGFIE